MKNNKLLQNALKVVVLAGVIIASQATLGFIKLSDISLMYIIAVMSAILLGVLLIKVGLKPLFSRLNK